MEKGLTKVTPKLPTVSELYTEDIEVVFKNEQLNLLLNQPPNEKWIKEHPFIAGYKYLPIDKIEFLLRKIFKEFKIEVLKTGMILNAVEVTVRVWYKHPITNEWMFHDGVGAQELQTQKGTGHLKLDMSNINKGAIMMALPIAKSVAIKDACDMFGRLFGSDLNRKDVLPFNSDAKLEEKATDHATKRIKMLLDGCKTESEINTIQERNPNFDVTIFNEYKDALKLKK